ncbi:MAG: hypothetical protein V1729_03140 [Candidatus Woesearchaeota archaeon]
MELTKTEGLKDKDRKILKVMQEQKLVVPQVTKIAHRVHEPPSTVRDRIASMEKSGTIKGYMPQLDPEKVGNDVLVFVLANLGNLENPSIPCKKIASFDFVQGVYFLIGEKDILIKVRANSIPDYHNKMALLRKYVINGGGIVVSKIFKDDLCLALD